MPNLPKILRLTNRQHSSNNTDVKMFKIQVKPQEISFTAKFEYFDFISTVDKIIIDLGKFLTIFFTITVRVFYVYFR